MNNNINIINNNINIIPINKYDDEKDDEVKEDELVEHTVITKLFGLDEITYNNSKVIPDKKDWKYCTYCDKYHGREFFMQIDYCIHCWAWLNAQEINLETGKYTGSISFDTIKTFIKKVYPIHLKGNCSNKECIFNKITEFAKNNKLNIIFSELLFNKQKIQLLGGLHPDKIVQVDINLKTHKLNINFTESEINI